MKLFKISAVGLIVYCFMSSTVWASTRAFEDGDIFGATVQTPLGPIRHANNATEFLDIFRGNKDIRATAADFDTATRQAQKFMNFLVGQHGQALLMLFAQQFFLDDIIKRGSKLTVTTGKFVRSIIPFVPASKDLCFGALDIDAENARLFSVSSFSVSSLKRRSLDSFIFQQFLEHHGDNLQQDKNPNLLRALFQYLRIAFLIKGMLTPSYIEKSPLILGAVDILSSTSPASWSSHDDATCVAMFGVFKTLYYAYATSNDGAKKLFFNLLTEDELSTAERMFNEQYSKKK